MKIEEKIIINAIAKRNRDIFKALFYEYYPLLTKYAEGFVFGREESEDIVQSFFIEFWGKADAINIQTSIKSYLYQSVKNRCLNYLRNLKVFDKHKLLYLEGMFSNNDGSNEFDPEWEDKVNLALNKLPSQMARVLRMKYMKGEKIVKIARTMNISENTVKTHLTRGKKRLHKQLLYYLNTLS
jgi:RNA polymerase sigma-70 factor (family 1)